jgi:hypothetical protein
MSKKKSKPLLKQFADIGPLDFKKHPVWVNCHIIDYEETWYEKTDEETFRPWLSKLPVSPAETSFLVAADFVLADGTMLQGFITPQNAQEAADLGALQPYIFASNGSLISFWYGMFPISKKEKARTYGALARTKASVFPIRFAAQKKLAKGTICGVIPGFCSAPKGKRIVVEF